MGSGFSQEDPCSSPYMEEDGGNWYKGTANAIYHNIDFIDSYDPEYVLILSGDHIYKMDYSKMLRFHREKESELTIAVIEVPWEEAFALESSPPMKTTG